MRLGDRPRSGDFGRFSHQLLIGNFGDGTVHAFDLFAGKHVGAMLDDTTEDSAISASGLSALAGAQPATENAQPLLHRWPQPGKRRHLRPVDCGFDRNNPATASSRSTSAVAADPHPPCIASQMQSRRRLCPYHSFRSADPTPDPAPLTSFAVSAPLSPTHAPLNPVACPGRPLFCAHAQDSLDKLSTDFWTWRAQYQPFTPMTSAHRTSQRPQPFMVAAAGPYQKTELAPSKPLDKIRPHHVSPAQRTDFHLIVPPSPPRSLGIDLTAAAARSHLLSRSRPHPRHLKLLLPPLLSTRARSRELIAPS